MAYSTRYRSLRRMPMRRARYPITRRIPYRRLSVRRVPIPRFRRLR